MRDKDNKDTWKGWKARGMHVKKGQKNCGFNEEGIALFNRTQVDMITLNRGYRSYGRDYSNYDAYDWDIQEGDYWV